MVQLDELDAVPSNVKVVVRVRPENEREQAAVRSHIVQVMDEHVLVFDPKEESSPNYYRGKRRRGRDLMKRKNRDLKFAFDRVFDQNETNNDVFEDTTKSLLEGVLNGYNCSVFAYGATGAGKTHTMLGNPNQPGVIFLTMMKLYEVIDQMKEDKTIDVAVSYLEVYNEKIKDLLLPSEYLPVREDPQKGVVVAGLSLHKPKSAEELMHMLDFGNRNRTQHPTDANAESSRSHAVFQVFVRQKDRTANISADVKVGKMSLIDLAGSERATVTKNRGQRLREGANINRSLLALGNCINALADSKYKGHVPYRNSKLTRLLKDSLGGNCRTVMIAAVSPSALSSEDTYNTLRYADRAKHIKAKLKKNVMSVDFHVSRYAQIVEELRAEVCQLKSKLHGYESGTVVSGGIVHVDQNEEVDRLLHSMRSVFSARVSIHKEIMDFECSQRDLEFRIYRKERTLSRLNSINLDPVTHEQITSKIQRQITAAQTRRCTLANKTMSGNERLDENNQWLDRVKSEINLAVEGGHTPEVVEVSMQAGHLEVELRDTRRQVKHLKKLVKAQDRETQTSEKLICGLIGLVRKQYFLLKGCNLATSDMTAEFESVQSAVINDREISWADQSFSESGESTVLRLIDLPVLSCAATPKTPSRKRRRSTVSRTPRTPGRKSFLAANNTMTPRRSTGKPKNNLGFTPSASPASSLTENSSSLRVTGQGSGESPNVIQECIENRIQAGVTPAPKTLDFGSHSDEEKSESDAETRMSHSVDSSAGDIGKFLRVEKGKQYPDTTKEMSLSPSCSDTSCQNSCPSDTTLIISSSDQEQSSGRRSLDETFTLPVGQDHLGLPMPMVSSSVESAEDESSSIPECIRSEACQGQGQGEVQLRLCGSSTVTKSKTIGDSRETGASRSITFNSPAGIRSFADAVRSPPSSNVLLSGYNSRSPLAVELEQSPAGEPANRRERKVDFVRNLANTKSTVGKNGSRGRGPAGFKPDRLKMIGQEHGDGGNGRVTSSPLRELNTGNPTLQRMGLPSMQRKCPTPKYMKLTAAAANKRRNNHNRSLSSKENTREVLSSQTLNSRRLSVYHDENGRPAGERRKNLAKSRSQSVSAFPRNTWQK